MKQCIIIAGPNGAGKTTFASEFLPREGNTVNFLNADLIAYGLSPLAVERVRLRVRQGGHPVPEDVIRRRYVRGWANLSLYQKAVDEWKIWDTSQGAPELIDEG